MAGNGSFNISYNNTLDIWPTKQEIASSPHWYLSMATTILVLLSNGWIAISFVHYLIVKQVFKKKRSNTDVNGGLVMVSAVIATVLPIFRYFGTIFLLIVSLYPKWKWGCEVANDILVFGYALAVFPTYTYLWARQRAFYGHPSLGSMFGTCVSVFSKISLLLILLSAIVAVGLGIHPIEYEHKPGGCYLIGNEEQGKYRAYLYATVMIASQISLLGLFLHPLLVHARHQRSFETNVEDKPEHLSSAEGGGSRVEVTHSENVIWCNGNVAKNPSYSPSVRVPAGKSQIGGNSERDRKRTISEPPLSDRKGDSSANFDHSATVVKIKRKSRRRSSKYRKLFVLIRRILYLAVISIVSDLTVTMINQFAIPDDIPQTYSFVMFDVNILINVLTVVMSFAHWRKMMSSPCAVTT